MKRVLCYGDSNTWGWNPQNTERYGEQDRWTGVLQNELGAEYKIIEEGLNGRTTVWEDPIEGFKSGKTYLIPCLETHKPLDLVIAMLGSNDLKKRFSLSAFDIAQGMSTILEMIIRSQTGIGGQSPKLLCVAPPPIGRMTIVGHIDFSEMFEGAEEKSRKLAHYYRQFASLCGCEFLDASQIVVPSEIDGIHLDISEHKKLAQAIAPVVRKIIG